MWSRCCSRRCRPSSASSPGAISPRCAANIFRLPVVYALWIVSEVAAMATDLAEFLGGAIGLSLILHIPLLAGMGVTAVLTYGILMFEGRGFRPTELIIGALVAAIALCYLVEIFVAPVDWARGGLRFDRAAISRRRRSDDRSRHRRRDDHAARHLPAFRPDAEPRPGAQRRRAPPVAAFLQHRGRSSPLRSPVWSIWRWW